MKELETPALQPTGEGGEHWISVSDLMAGLMMVFLLIAVVYMEHITTLTGQWQDTKRAIHRALEEEFKDDKERWQMADIDPDTLTIKFLSPEILFERGKHEIRPRFRQILDDFFPRYITLLHKRFKSDIREIRIEGHASSDWGRDVSRPEAFIMNMKLSQNRAQEVMVYCFEEMAWRKGLMAWMTETVSANGHSYAQRKLSEDRREDREASRRVEFTIRPETDEILYKLMPIPQRR